MCCGKNRLVVSQTRVFSRGGRTMQTSRTLTSRQPSYVAYFEYTGKTAMTVVGPVSGMWYRFAAPGSRIPVDFRDRAALTAVPSLVQVQSL